MIREMKNLVQSARRILVIALVASGLVLSQSLAWANQAFCTQVSECPVMAAAVPHAACCARVMPMQCCAKLLAPTSKSVSCCKIRPASRTILDDRQKVSVEPQTSASIDVPAIDVAPITVATSDTRPRSAAPVIKDRSVGSIAPRAPPMFS